MGVVEPRRNRDSIGLVKDITGWRIVNDDRVLQVSTYYREILEEEDIENEKTLDFCLMEKKKLHLLERINQQLK